MNRKCAITDCPNHSHIGGPLCAFHAEAKYFGESVARGRNPREAKAFDDAASVKTLYHYRVTIGDEKGIQKFMSDDRVLQLSFALTCRFGHDATIEVDVFDDLLRAWKTVTGLFVDRRKHETELVEGRAAA